MCPNQLKRILLILFSQFQENPVVLVQQLSLVKSRYKTLCEQLEKISLERRESMRSIRATLAKTVKLVQEIQHHTGMEVGLSVYLLESKHISLTKGIFGFSP